MINKYYKCTKTGKIVNLNIANDYLEAIFGSGTVDNLLEEGAIVEMKEVSYEQLIQNGMFGTAILEYREANKCGLPEAKEKIIQIRNSLKGEEK